MKLSQCGQKRPRFLLPGVTTSNSLVDAGQQDSAGKINNLIRVWKRYILYCECLSENHRILDIATAEADESAGDSTFSRRRIVESKISLCLA